MRSLTIIGGGCFGILIACAVVGGTAQLFNEIIPAWGWMLTGVVGYTDWSSWTEKVIA